MPLIVSPTLRWLATASRQGGHAVGDPPAGWEAVLGLARRHRVQSLLYHGLTGRAEPLPAAVGTVLQADSRAIALDNLRGMQECSRLKSAFAEAHVPLLFVKGLTLSQLAYGNPILKMSRDIDLLVAPNDIGSAARILLALGYELEQPRNLDQFARWHRWSKESQWRGPGGLLVELHSRLTDHPGLLHEFEPAEPTHDVVVGPSFSLPTLRSDQLLAYLAVHGASSAWFRLKWLADFDALLNAGDGNDLDGVHLAMVGAGAGRAAGQALLLVNAVYGTPLPESLRQRLEKSRATRWLASESLRQLECTAEPTERRGGTLGLHATQMLIGERWSFPLREGLRRTGEVLFRRLNGG